MRKFFFAQVDQENYLSDSHERQQYDTTRNHAMNLTVLLLVCLCFHDRRLLRKYMLLCLQYELQV